MFSARRKPKRAAREELDRPSNDEEEQEQKDGPVVRRPAAPSKSKSKLRTSFAPDEAEDSIDAPAVIKARPRTGHAVSSQSLARLGAESRSQDNTVSRPSYSKSALEELRNSTPSTPKDLSIYDPSSGAEDGIRNLDIASKHAAIQSATPVSRDGGNAIPSASEIAEKKARRARLAKEQGAAAEDFISLEDETMLYDSDGEFKPRRMQVGAYRRPDPGEADTRLIRDDEDVLEGFDDFTEDVESKRITMGQKQLRQAKSRDRDALRELIDSAEGNHHRRHDHQHPSDDDSDNNASHASASDSEIERNHAYETAQTSHGMDGLRAAKEAYRKAGAYRPRPPREVTPVPKLAAAQARPKEIIAQVELEKVKIERRRAAIRTERADVRANLEHIQQSLVEAGEELEKVRQRQAEEEQKNTREMVVSTELDVPNGNGTVTDRRGFNIKESTSEPT